MTGVGRAATVAAALALSPVALLGQDAADPPRSTQLYQSFPNPFPSASGQAACFWFDLALEDEVRLEIYDLRGNLVRILLPAAGLPVRFAPGRYGRPAGASEGCDNRFTWDGTAADGRVVPAGIYLARLRAAGVDARRKIVFRGR